MRTPFLILGVCAMVAGCTETRVIRDNSVTAQFMKLDGRNGARVTLGDGSSRPKPAVRPTVVAADTNWAPGSKPFANATWSTNFKVDQPRPAGAPNSPDGPTTPPGAAPNAPSIDPWTLPAAPATQPSSSNPPVPNP